MIGLIGHEVVTMKSLKVFTFILLLLSLSACTVKLVYNNLDWVVKWYVDDYISLTAEQKPIFNAHLAELLHYHRQHHLPEYASLLQDIAREADQGLTVDEIQSYQNRFGHLIETLVAEAIDPLTILLAQMNDQQVQALQDGFDKANRSFIERFISTSEDAQRQRQAQNLAKMLQRFVGSLNTQQLAMIQHWSTEYHLMGVEFLQTRLGWQAQFLDMLAERHQADFKQRLHAFLLSPAAQQSVVYQEKVANNQQLMWLLLVNINSSLDAKQKQSLQRNLHKLAEDFTELALHKTR